MTKKYDGLDEAFDVEVSDVQIDKTKVDSKIEKIKSSIH